MKKLLAVLTVLALLWTAAGAMAETAGMPDLYDLYDTSDGERTWIGTAVPIMDGVTLASPAEFSRRTSRMEVWDGTAYREVSLTMTTGDGTVLVLLHETDGEESGIPPYPFLEAGRIPEAGEMIVRSGDWMQSRINRAVYDVTVFTWKDREAMLLTLSGDTVPGAPVVTPDGKLVGIIAAQYAEGPNRYIALTVPSIAGCMQEAANLLENPSFDSRPDGYAVTVDGNLVTFSWEGMELPQPGEGEKLYHVVSEVESTYLTYMEITGATTEVTMLLTPGRTYVSGIGTYPGIPDGMPEQLAVTAIPEAEPLTDHHFRSEVFAIAEMAPDAAAGAMPVPVTEVSETLLRSGKGCIYSVTSYEVDGKKDDSTLLITLTAPDGNNYRYESGWYYDPDIMGRDEWYVTLDKAGILEMLNKNGYPEGTYTMDMYIDGQLADHFSFELIK